MIAHRMGVRMVLTITQPAAKAAPNLNAAPGRISLMARPTLHSDTATLLDGFRRHAGASNVPGYGLVSTSYTRGLLHWLWRTIYAPRCAAPGRAYERDAVKYGNISAHYQVQIGLNSTDLHQFLSGSVRYAALAAAVRR